MPKIDITRTELVWPGKGTQKPSFSEKPGFF